MLMKTKEHKMNTKKKTDIMANLKKLLDKPTPFSQSKPALGKTLGSSAKNPFSQPKSTSANKLIKNKKNKA